jgi:hypothetical protein
MPRPRRTPAEVLAAQMPERDLQDAVIKLGRLYGWRTAHFRPAMTKYGWRTPVQGDGKGFPDTILVRGDRFIVAELKAERGTVAPEQQAWLDDWRQVGAEVYVWRPSDLATVAEILK